MRPGQPHGDGGHSASGDFHKGRFPEGHPVLLRHSRWFCTLGPQNLDPGPLWGLDWGVSHSCAPGTWRPLRNRGSSGYFPQGFGKLLLHADLTCSPPFESCVAGTVGQPVCTEHLCLLSSPVSAVRGVFPSWVTSILAHSAACPPLPIAFVLVKRKCPDRG